MAPAPAPLPVRAVAAALGGVLGPHELRWRGGAEGRPPFVEITWRHGAATRSATLTAPHPPNPNTPWTVHLPGGHLRELRETMQAAAAGPLAPALALLAREDAARRAWANAPHTSPLGWPREAEVLPWSAAPSLHARSVAWLDAWQRWAGASPVLVAHPDGGSHSVRLPAPPAAATEAEQRVTDGFFLDAAAHLLGHRAVAERFVALGFGCDADGRVRTVPSPAGFAERARALGLAPPFSPRLRRSRWALMRERRWLEAWASGELAIHVASERFYRATAWAGHPVAQRVGWLRELWIGHHAGFAHDIGVHAAATHALPWRFGLRVRSAIRDALLARGAARPRTLAPLLRYFEDDLTERCLARWRAIGDADFAATWQARDAEPALQTLERRLAEARGERAR